MTPEVNCPQCGEVNPATARFCMACGASLARNCPSCGVEAATGARFCGACGASLDGAAPASAAHEERATVEERRTVTVAFADVSGYTAVAERLDHETVKALIERCLTRLAAEVEIFGGRVDKYIGDNVMAVFGAPTAHEDDAERAVRAALGMQAAMSELNRAIAPEFGFELGLRIGVNTGEVLAGRIGEAYTVVGDTVNVASRLQAAAPVGGILVGERTQRLSATSIVYRKLEPVSLKGKANPVPVWEALAVKEPEASSEAPAAGTPLVGRGEQLGQLEALFERAVRDTGPQQLTVIGEAGVGKSRLLREFEALLQRREPPVRTRRGRCLAFGSSVVYWPLIEMLRAECGILDVDSSEHARAKLTERLGPLLSAHEDPELVEHRLASLARLLGAELPEDHLAGAEEDQQSARESFFGAVRAVFEALASEGAVVLAWEDVHWADEGTLDLIEYLSQWLRAPVLQVCLARDELLARRPNWSTLRRTVTTIFLEPLDQRDTRALIAALLGESVTAIELPETLAERSGGNPLFAEEMVQRIAAEGGATAAELPDTIQGLLAARLDSLEPFERQLVAHAAVLGRTFWEGALEPLAAAAGENLTSTLAGLREKDIIIPGEGGSAGQRELAFKHVLIRDVAYEILPKAERARKHAEVGAFIERGVGEGGEGIVALAAEHYARAAALGGEVHMPVEELDGLRTRALECGEAAGDTAAALYSNLEALAHYDTAATFAEPGGTSAQRIAEKRGDVAFRLGRLELAIEAWEGCLAHHVERDEREQVAELHRKIGSALAHKGERKLAIEHHQRGINLVKDLPPSLALVRLYEEAAWLYMQVGDNMLAIYASEKALRLAESLGEVRAAGRAHGIFGRVFGRIGDKAKARENLERAVELARDSDAGETVLALLAQGHNLEHSEGDYDAAKGCYVEALELAEKIGDLPGQIELEAALGELAFVRCDWAELRRASDASAELAEREGLVGKLCLASALRGRLRWREGEWDAAESLFARAHELAGRAGLSEVSVEALMGLAETLRDRGDLAGAEATLEQALAICERAGLISQSVQAHAAMTQLLSVTERMPSAREAAEQAQTLAAQVHDPVSEACALEARGLVAEPVDALQALGEARAAWERLDRPLDIARCDVLLGRCLRDGDPSAAAEAFRRAGERYAALGVDHLAKSAEEHAGLSRATAPTQALPLRGGADAR